MSSRVHWVYMAAPGNPRFDAAARAFFQDHIRRKILDTMSITAADRALRRVDGLPPNFRKAIPLLQEIATEQGFTFTKKLRMFRLPKHLRRAKNPIYSWKSAA